jgi:AraC-like DNA-binding protein
MSTQPISILQSRRQMPSSLVGIKESKDLRSLKKGKLCLGLLPIFMIHPFIECCDRHRWSLDVVLTEADFPGQHVEDREGYISGVDTGRLLEAMARLARNRDFAFRAASVLSMSDLGDFVHVLQGAATVGELIDRYVEHLHLFETVSRSWVEYSREGALWCLELRNPEAPGADILEEFLFLVQLSILRSVLSGDWIPRKLLFKRQGPLPAEFGRHLVAAAMPGAGRHGIMLDREVLAQPLASSRRFSQTQLDSWSRRLAANAPAQNVLEALAQALRHALSSQRYSLHQMAQRMNVSARSLQRFLADQDLTYSEVVEGVRRDLAMEMLGQEDLSITEIALELGYTDSANFSRAFKRFTGETPRSYRKAVEGLAAFPRPSAGWSRQLVQAERPASRRASPAEFTAVPIGAAARWSDAGEAYPGDRFNTIRTAALR